MKKLDWNDGLMETIDSLCEIFPEVIKERWKERLIYNSEKIAFYEGSPIVTDDIFWKSVYEVLPGGYEPLILKIKDPEMLKAEMISSRNQEGLKPGTEPVKITRWANSHDAFSAFPTGKNTRC